MIMALLTLVGGITLLLGGGDLLVRGASGLARALGVSPTVIGLTIVAFGTSAPELVVSITGSLRGEGALIFGNVIGSNLANLGLVLGITLLLVPIVVQGQIVRREIPLLLLASTMLLVMMADPVLRGLPPSLDRADGAILLLMFVLFTYVNAADVVRERAHDPILRQASRRAAMIGHWPLLRDLAFMAAGILGLSLGGKLTIDGGVALATGLGVEPVVIGLTVIAVGTSLPELATSAIAARRGAADLAVGNIIGSNLFNVLFVLPIAAVVRPLELPVRGFADAVFALVLTVLLLPLVISARYVLDRKDASILILLYTGYVGWRAFAA